MKKEVLNTVYVLSLTRVCVGTWAPFYNRLREKPNNIYNSRYLAYPTPSFRHPFIPPLPLPLLSRFSLVRCGGSIFSVLPLGVRNTEGSPLPVLVDRKCYLLFSL